MNLFTYIQWCLFYLKANTRYQVHSPFVFDLCNAVLEESRFYYAFRDIERLRQQMLASQASIQQTDYGAGGPAHAPRKIADIVRNAGSSSRQGRWLFHLVRHLQPASILELGTSLGLGTLYLAGGAPAAKIITLEGCPQTAAVARQHFGMQGQDRIQLRTGPFENSLLPVLEDLGAVDFIFFDGNHRPEPTLHYFEACLKAAHPNTVFVFDDMYWSVGMRQAWLQIQQHRQVTLSVDFFDLSMAWINPDFKVKQHFRLVPERWKPWKVF
jgi:predicted O-methyltransferase YrrM